MMEGLRQYVLGVTAAALICGVASGLVKDGAGKGVIRLLCGLILAFAAIRPLTRLDLTELLQIPYIYTQEAETAAAMGEDMAKQAMADIIKAQTEAYILKEATALNADISPQVTVALVENTPVPVSVSLSGQASPYARTRLEQILQTQLGIAKENQLWTG